MTEKINTGETLSFIYRSGGIVGREGDVIRGTRTRGSGGGTGREALGPPVFRGKVGRGGEGGGGRRVTVEWK